MSDRVWWQEGRAPAPAAGSPPARADVAIVGAGVGGLALAWRLLDLGVRPVIVDARRVAAGASGRNGGFFIAGAAPMYNDARRAFGADLARRIHAATLAAQAEVYALAADIGAAGAFRRVGMLRLAVDADEAAHVREHAAALAADGFPGELVAEADLPAPLRRPGRIGLRTAHDASVQPVEWLEALADAVVARGARIVQGVAVRRAVGREDAGPPALELDTGPLAADAVVVAADAAIGSLVPPFAGRVRPRRLHMVATAPRAGDHVGHPVYARYGYEYHQQLPDGRVVLGGFSDLDGRASYTDHERTDDRVVARLQTYLADELGIVAPVTHRWTGIVGYTRDQRPDVGAVPGAPGLFVMGGYCGTGNVVAWVAARIVADLIVSGRSSEADLFDSGRPSPPAGGDDEHGGDHQEPAEDLQG